MSWLSTTFSWSAWQAHGKEWLLRIAATLALAVAWHVWSSWSASRRKIPIAAPTPPLLADNPEDRAAAIKSRQAFLDQLEKSKGMGIDTNSDQTEEEDEGQDDAGLDSKSSPDESQVNADHDATETPTTTDENVTPLSPKPKLQSHRASKYKTTKSIAIKLTGNRAVRTPRPSQPSQEDPAPIVFHNETPFHPGLEASGFYNWYDVETSLYRIYRLGRTDGVEVIPPYLPQSRRGHVQIYLKVSNAMYCTIEAFWVDFQGREVSKGKFRHGTVWSQTTWMEHPWVFRKCDDSSDSQQLLLHYIPYRVIPTTGGVPTTSPDDPNVGMHQFTLTTNRRQDESYWACQVEDPVLPHPASRHFQNNTETAIAWVLEHMLRTNYHDLSLVVLEKYLKNITLRPEEAKFRHWRTAASTKFYQHVWNTAARGLLLSLGAVEQGAFCELGTADNLRHERVQDISQLLSQLRRWKENRDRDEGSLSKQPEGAEDGYGRAGYGRAGQIN